MTADHHQQLPSNLKSSTHRDVPATVQDRVHYLWTLISSTSMAAKLASTMGSSEDTSTSDSITNPNESTRGHLDVLHRLSRDFMGLVKEHAIELPSAIQERHCRSCCVVLIPALTSSVRLRKRTHRSRVNRSNHLDRIETELVGIDETSALCLWYVYHMFLLQCLLSSLQIERCLMCDTVRKAAALHRNKPEPISGSTPRAGKLTDNEAQKANKGTSVGSAQKRQFSFLHHRGGGGGVSATIPAQRGSIDSYARRSSAPGRIGQQDFLSFSTTSIGRFGSMLSPITKSFSSRPRPSAEETGNSQARPQSSEFNLLELERTNKKKQQQRRRTLGQTTPQK